MTKRCPTCQQEVTLDENAENVLKAIKSMPLPPDVKVETYQYRDDLLPKATDYASAMECLRLVHNELQDGYDPSLMSDALLGRHLSLFSSIEAALDGYFTSEELGQFEVKPQ